MLIRFIPGIGMCSFLPDTEEILVPVSPGENFRSILLRINRFCTEQDLPLTFVLFSDDVEQCTASNTDDARLAVQKLQRDLASMDEQKLEYEEARETGAMSPSDYYAWLRRFRTARDAKVNELTIAQHRFNMLSVVEADDLITCKRHNARLAGDIQGLRDNRERLLKQIDAAQEEVAKVETRYNEKMEKVFNAYGSRDVDAIARLLTNLSTKKQVTSARRAINEWRVIAVFLRFLHGLGIEMSEYPPEVQTALRTARSLVSAEKWAGYAPILTDDMEIDSSALEALMGLLKAKEKA